MPGLDKLENQILMDWQIQPLARRCALTNEPLETGERIACFLYRDEQGQLARADVRESAAGDFHCAGAILGRWGRTVKDRGEEEREARQQQLASTEELFLSLYQMEDDSPNREREALKQLLALLLERKRVLRPQGPPKDGLALYLHIRSKQSYPVPMHDIPLEQLLPLQEQLATLVT